MNCTWASCAAPATSVVEGYPMCPPHVDEHHYLTREPVVRTRKSQNRPVLPCGTRAAFQRHWQRSETACGPCVEANRAYQRERRRAA